MTLTATSELPTSKGVASPSQSRNGRAPKSNLAFLPPEAHLAIAAGTFDDLERNRIAMDNRLRALRDDHGAGETTEFARLEAMSGLMAQLEHEAELELGRALRRHPLGDFCKRTVGIGMKQGARLLAAIGDPYMREAQYDEDENLVEDARPRRGPAELWQYCGHGDPARSRKRKGHRVEFNPEAKKRVWLIADRCKMMTGKPDKNGKLTPFSPYRVVYDEARAKYADATHAEPCVRCGPAGKPALAGSPLSDGHKDARAVRAAGKALLKDLYNESRRLHGAAS